MIRGLLVVPLSDRSMLAEGVGASRPPTAVREPDGTWRASQPGDPSVSWQGLILAWDQVQVWQGVETLARLPAVVTWGHDLPFVLDASHALLTAVNAILHASPETNTFQRALRRLDGVAHLVDAVVEVVRG